MPTAIGYGTTLLARVSRPLRALALCAFVAAVVATNFQTVTIYDRYFTHYDDIGVAVYLSLNDVDTLERREAICRSKATSVAFLRSSERISGYVRSTCAHVAYMYRLVVIPLGWTYAPLQFVLTQALLDQRYVSDLQDVKTLGRLPSLLFLFAGLATLYGLARTQLPLLCRTYFLPILAVALVSISLEQKIMASQMWPYATGVLSNVLILYALILLRKISGNTSSRSVFFASFLITIGIAMHYQGLFLAFAGVIAVAVHSWRRGVFNMAVVRKFILLISSLFLFGLVTYIPFLANVYVSRGANISRGWNAGPSGEFLVDPGLPLFHKALEFATLLATETFHNVYAMMTGIEVSGRGISDAIGFAYFLLASLGVVFIFRRRRNEFFRFALILVTAYAGVVAFLIFTGRLTFSPTRHLTYFIVPISILACYGALALFKVRPLRTGLILLACVYMGYAITQFSGFARGRLDRIDEQEFVRQLEAASVQVAVYDTWDLELLLMNRVKSYSIRLGDAVPCDQSRKFAAGQISRVAWFSRRRSFDVAKPEIEALLHDLVSRCSQDGGSMRNSIGIGMAEDIIVQRSDVSIDLSNRASSGGNQIFLQFFEITVGR